MPQWLRRRTPERGLTQGANRVADSADSGAGWQGAALRSLCDRRARTGKTAQQVEDALRAEVARVAREGGVELERVKPSGWPARCMAATRCKARPANWAATDPGLWADAETAFLRSCAP